MENKIIAHMRTDFPGKFGIPRQSAVVSGLKGKIVFEKEYRREEMLRGLEGFSHLWVLWIFSENPEEKGESKWSPTVRPPRLGGNERVGVFASRSPFRPNPIGLSAVRIVKLDMESADGPVIYVEGADMVDGTPIIDIKPYVAFTDSIPKAVSGFVDDVEYEKLPVSFSEAAEKCFEQLPEDIKENLKGILENDPRPHYRKDSDRVYRFEYAGYHIGFTVENGKLKVCSLEPDSKC